MNSPSQNASATRSTAAPCGASDSAEDTLRLIAKLPPPRGLEDRVIAGLKSAPPTTRILPWPSLLQPAGSWMRSAAAAAIVCVVAGGGWGIYSHVQPSQPATGIVMPPRIGATPGFSSAGAMRTPQTINGPVLTKPASVHPATAQPQKLKAPAKAPVRAVTMPLRRPKVVVVDKPQPSAAAPRQ